MSLTMIGMVTSCARDAAGLMVARTAAPASAVKARRDRSDLTMLIRFLLSNASRSCWDRVAGSGQLDLLSIKNILQAGYTSLPLLASEGVFPKMLRSKLLQSMPSVLPNDGRRGG
ncbi:protein of unknown function [Shinella sp. WSC3-e]|nr:protein of unknown function [Shinella sp. WSC3-e]